MNRQSHYKTFILVSAGAILVSAARLASAQTPVTVPDFSFEDPTTANFQNNQGIAAGSAIPGTGNAWYYLGGSTGGGSPVGVENTAGNSMSTGGLGTQNGYVNKGSSMGSTGLLSIAANTTYTLTVAEARRSNGFNQTGGFTIALGYGTTPGVTPTIGASQFFGLPVAQSVFTDYTVSFTTGASGPAIGQNLFVVLSSENTAGNNPVDFDNVRVTSVPEPSSIAFFVGAAGLALVFYRRRTA